MPVNAVLLERLPIHADIARPVSTLTSKDDSGKLTYAIKLGEPVRGVSQTADKIALTLTFAKPDLHEPVLMQSAFDHETRLHGVNLVAGGPGAHALAVKAEAALPFTLVADKEQVHLQFAPGSLIGEQSAHFDADNLVAWLPRLLQSDIS